MVNQLKKLWRSLTPPPKPKVSAVQHRNEELIERARNYIYQERLNDLVGDTVFKNLIVTCYSSSLSELASWFGHAPSNRQLVGVPIHAYIADSAVPLTMFFQRVVDLLETAHISSAVRHDLCELMDACDFILE